LRPHRPPPSHADHSTKGFLGAHLQRSARKFLRGDSELSGQWHLRSCTPVHASTRPDVTMAHDTQSPTAIFKPVLVLISGRSIGFLAAFAIPIVLARVFSQEDFGTYKQLFLVYATLFGIMQLGMAESLYYFLPSRQRDAGSYIVNALGVLGLCGGLCLVLTLQQEAIASLLNNPGLVGKLPYIGMTLLFMLMAVVLEIVMTVRRQHLAA